MASNTDVVKKNYYNMSVLCLYLCLLQTKAPISKQHLQNYHNFLSPRKLSRGIMESLAYVCLSVCLFVCYHDN